MTSAASISGEFHSDDLVLVVLKNRDFYTTNFDLNNHYEPTGILRVEKFDEEESVDSRAL